MRSPTAWARAKRTVERVLQKARDQLTVLLRPDPTHPCPFPFAIAGAELLEAFERRLREDPAADLADFLLPPRSPGSLRRVNRTRPVGYGVRAPARRALRAGTLLRAVSRSAGRPRCANGHRVRGLPAPAAATVNRSRQTTTRSGTASPPPTGRPIRARSKTNPTRCSPMAPRLHSRARASSNSEPRS